MCQEKGYLSIVYNMFPIYF